MRIRAKISFIALEKRMTIVELFAQTIHKCVKQLLEKGYLPKVDFIQKAKDKMMMDGLMSAKMHGFMKNIILYNFSRFKEFDTHVKYIATKELVHNKLNKEHKLETVI